ncbi:MAG: DUF512 domain-containing protein, partial [Cyanobacteria bacterium P01_A01_bin.114]
QVAPPRRLTWVVGNAVERAFEPILTRLNQIEGLTVELAALSSQYWGQAITVTGLLTGQDIDESLKGRDLGAGIVLPALMLKKSDSQALEDTYFLDDMSVAELSRRLNCPVWPVDDINALIATCLAPLSPLASLSP